MPFVAGLLSLVAFAVGAMRTHKLRSALTLLGVVAGVATVIMMVSFVVGFNNQITAAFTTFGTHLVQFQKFEPRFGPDGVPEEHRTDNLSAATHELRKTLCGHIRHSWIGGDCSERS